MKITHRLGGLAAALTAVTTSLPDARLRVSVGSGVVEASVDSIVAATLASLRWAISVLDGQVVVASAPDGAKKELDVWGPVRGLAVMQRIKDQFDPDGRMCRGRFVVST